MHWHLIQTARHWQAPLFFNFAWSCKHLFILFSYSLFFFFAKKLNGVSKWFEILLQPPSLSSVLCCLLSYKINFLLVYKLIYVHIIFMSGPTDFIPIVFMEQLVWLAFKAVFYFLSCRADLYPCLPDSINFAEYIGSMHLNTHQNIQFRELSPCV
jgi:hypothetical protein